MSYKLCCCFDHRKRVWTFSDLLVRWSRLPTAKILRPADLHIVSVLEGGYQWLYLLAWRHPLLCMCQFVPSVAVPSGMKTPTVVHVSVGATSGCTFWHEDTHCCACVSWCHQWLYLLLWWHWGMQTVLQCISWCCQWLYLLPWWH